MSYAREVTVVHSARRQHEKSGVSRGQRNSAHGPSCVPPPSVRSGGVPTASRTASGSTGKRQTGERPTLQPTKRDRRARAPNPSPRPAAPGSMLHPSVDMSSRGS